MGNLYGSEYWTYLLPKRVGAERAQRITQGRMPIGTRAALELGLVDAQSSGTPADFLARAIADAQSMIAAGFEARIAAKRATRRTDESTKPLAAYRAEELEKMRLNFFGFDSSYHVARHSFVCKVPKARTPSYLALHRSLAGSRTTAD
jgi:putative two-component system hydrogenase maturation factor HypX/HoxX